MRLKGKSPKTLYGVRSEFERYRISQRRGMKTCLGTTPHCFAHSCSTSQGGCFGARKIKNDRGNPKLEHGQGLVNDQTCLNK